MEAEAIRASLLSTPVRNLKWTKDLGQADGVLSPKTQILGWGSESSGTAEVTLGGQAVARSRLDCSWSWIRSSPPVLSSSLCSSTLSKPPLWVSSSAWEMLISFQERSFWLMLARVGFCYLQLRTLTALWILKCPSHTPGEPCPAWQEPFLTAAFCVWAPITQVASSLSSFSIFLCLSISFWCNLWLPRWCSW